MAFDFTLVNAPFRMQPGLSRIAEGDRQLTPSAADGRHLREKLAVLGSFAEQALVSIPAFDLRPVLRAIAQEAARSSPAAFEYQERGARCSAPLLGWSIVDDMPEPDGPASASVSQMRAFAPCTRRLSKGP